MLSDVPRSERESEKESSTMSYYIFTKKQHQEEKKKTFCKRKKNSWEIYLHFCYSRTWKKFSFCFLLFFLHFLIDLWQTLCAHTKKNSSDIMKCSQHRKWSFYCIENLKRIEMGLKIVMSQAKSRISNCVEAGKFSLLS